MFQAVNRSSSGALTVFAASGLHTHVVTGRSQVWVGNKIKKLKSGPHKSYLKKLSLFSHTINTV
jgi:hypothetical protein